MDLFSAYLPMDRRQAIANRKPLPETATGSAIFADISGFTSLTEMLSHELGAQRGAEELTHQLNQVYDALISQVHRFGGSVIGFSGDAITCWFDQDDGGRAVACALAMQTEMRQFARIQIVPKKTVTLELKTAVTAGKVRRFLVGDPNIQVIEVLSGDLVNRLAEIEHQSRRSEVVLDENTARALSHLIIPGEVRLAAEESGGVVVVQGLQMEVSDHPWRPLPAKRMTKSRARPWLLKPVYERLLVGQGEFLAELRPAVALFLRFTGIDYEHDPSSQRILDKFVQQVQRTLQEFDGTLIQVTIGDKGSYLYSAFGAPVAHEDDPLRAVQAAFALREIAAGFSSPITVQIGITLGHMRVGAYGGADSRTYGVLGDSVNLSARLMQAAAPGQILATLPVTQATAGKIEWQEKSVIQVKGKTAPVEIFEPIAVQSSKGFNLLGYDLQKMVGRAGQLAEIARVTDRAMQGKGQVIGITGEAGLGKSELVRHAASTARWGDHPIYKGDCQAYGANTGYLVWRPIFDSFFGLVSTMETDRKIDQVTRQLTAIDPMLTQRLPLLAPVLDLPIPDNDLTRNLDAKIRKSALESMLVECVQFRARSEPLIFILEDVQWLDALSHDLLEAICRTIADRGVLVIMVFRPATIERLKVRRVRSLPWYTEIALEPLTDEEMGELVQEQISRLYGQEGPVAGNIIQQIISKAEGNPFFAEQSITFLHDSGLDLHTAAGTRNLTLPSSLQSLILSRLDQLTESQKITLKVASVIGRVFRAALLWGVHGNQNNPLQINQDLEKLTPVELGISEDQTELTYFFQHILTQEVAYESIPFATRSTLHEQIAGYIESHYAQVVPQLLDFLAFHYGRSENRSKKIEYFLKAAEASRQKFANQTAIEYYQGILDWLEPLQRVDVTLKLCQVLEVVGQWDESHDLYRKTRELAEELAYPLGAARCEAGLGELYRKQGNYTEAEATLKSAYSAFEKLNDSSGMAQTLQSMGSMFTQLGKMEQAGEYYQASLSRWQQLGQLARVASLYSNLGIIARLAGDYSRARDLTEKGLEIRRQLADQWAVAVSLNNLGNIALDEGKADVAHAYLEEAVALQRQVGDKYYIANALNNLANVIRQQGEYSQAFSLYTESLLLTRDLGDRWALAYLLEDIGCLASLAGKYSPAIMLVGAASAVRESIKSPLSPDEIRKMEELLEPARTHLSLEDQQRLLETGRSLSLEVALERAITIF